ncbi:hypothetical protein PCL_07050 [Purpureocillium lilacinum]|uniref:Uncharacterized protein n=1 Tax=Purpureocillium lilacinum TaxID=33203 RepID=A0A2U3DT75_PURLI|nr:hypothetical protein PCL_07050 [Purpureocillium lilacinum]
MSTPSTAEIQIVANTARYALLGTCWDPSRDLLQQVDDVVTNAEHFLRIPPHHGLPTEETLTERLANLNNITVQPNMQPLEIKTGPDSSGEIFNVAHIERALSKLNTCSKATFNISAAHSSEHIYNLIVVGVWNVSNVCWHSRLGLPGPGSFPDLHRVRLHLVIEAVVDALWAPSFQQTLRTPGPQQPLRLVFGPGGYMLAPFVPCQPSPNPELPPRSDSTLIRPSSGCSNGSATTFEPRSGRASPVASTAASTASKDDGSADPCIIIPVPLRSNVALCLKYDMGAAPDAQASHMAIIDIPTQSVQARTGESNLSPVKSVFPPAESVSGDHSAASPMAEDLRSSSSVANRESRLRTCLSDAAAVASLHLSCRSDTASGDCRPLVVDNSTSRSSPVLKAGGPHTSVRPWSWTTALVSFVCGRTAHICARPGRGQQHDALGVRARQGAKVKGYTHEYVSTDMPVGFERWVTATSLHSPFSSWQKLIMRIVDLRSELAVFSPPNAPGFERVRRSLLAFIDTVLPEWPIVSVDQVYNALRAYHNQPIPKVSNVTPESRLFWLMLSVGDLVCHLYEFGRYELNHTCSAAVAHVFLQRQPSDSVKIQLHVLELLCSRYVGYIKMVDLAQAVQNILRLPETNWFSYVIVWSYVNLLWEFPQSAPVHANPLALPLPPEGCFTEMFGSDAWHLFLKKCTNTTAYFQLRAGMPILNLSFGGDLGQMIGWTLYSTQSFLDVHALKGDRLPVAVNVLQLAEACVTKSELLLYSIQRMDHVRRLFALPHEAACLGRLVMAHMVGLVTREVILRAMDRAIAFWKQHWVAARAYYDRLLRVEQMNLGPCIHLPNLIQDIPQHAYDLDLTSHNFHIKRILNDNALPSVGSSSGEWPTNLVVTGGAARNVIAYLNDLYWGRQIVESTGQINVGYLTGGEESNKVFGTSLDGASSPPVYRCCSSLGGRHKCVSLHQIQGNGTGAVLGRPWADTDVCRRIGLQENGTGAVLGRPGPTQMCVVVSDCRETGLVLFLDDQGPAQMCALPFESSRSAADTGGGIDGVEYPGFGVLNARLGPETTSQTGIKDAPISSLLERSGHRRGYLGILLEPSPPWM